MSEVATLHKMVTEAELPGIKPDHIGTAEKDVDRETVETESLEAEGAGWNTHEFVTWVT